MDLKLYVVKNKEGKYFRAKGYGGYGETWVDSIQSARIYTKLAPARGVVSWFATNYPQFGIPELHQLNVTSTTVLDETDRVNAVLKRKKEEKILQEKRNAEWQIQSAERQLKEAQEKLNKLRK